jgi:hypothetical protein
LKEIPRKVRRVRLAPDREGRLATVTIREENIEKEVTVTEIEVIESKAIEVSKKEKFLNSIERKYEKKVIDEEIEFPRKPKFKKVTISMFAKRDRFMEMSTFRNINRNGKEFKKAIGLADIDSLSWTMVEYRNIPDKLKMEFKLIFGMIWCGVYQEIGGRGSGHPNPVFGSARV